MGRITGQSQRRVVVLHIHRIGVQVDHLPHLRPAGARAIGLTHRAAADDHQQIGLFHRPVAADRAFRSTDMQVLQMGIRKHSYRAGRKHHGRARGLGQMSHGCRRVSRAATRLDGNPRGTRDGFCGPGNRMIPGWGHLRVDGSRGQGIQPQRHGRRSGVQRQVQEKRSGPPRVKDATGPLAHRIPQAARTVQRARAPISEVIWEKTPCAGFGTGCML